MDMTYCRIACLTCQEIFGNHSRKYRCGRIGEAHRYSSTSSYTGQLWCRNKLGETIRAQDQQSAVPISREAHKRSWRELQRIKYGNVCDRIFHDHLSQVIRSSRLTITPLYIERSTSAVPS